MATDEEEAEGDNCLLDARGLSPRVCLEVVGVTESVTVLFEDSTPEVERMKFLTAFSRSKDREGEGGGGIPKQPGQGEGRPGSFYCESSIMANQPDHTLSGLHTFCTSPPPHKSLFSGEGWHV